MTRDVVRARRDMPFKEIVKLLADSDVTAVPVVDDLDRPLGVVSEADLLRKSSAQADPSGRTPIPHLEAWERAKAEGARAEELMSAPAVCARPEWTVVETARLLAVQNIKRLPVVDETDRLLGIVSRGDLLRIFLRRDDAIHDEITRDVLQRTLRLAPSQVTVEVREGQVALGGRRGREPDPRHRPAVPERRRRGLGLRAHHAPDRRHPKFHHQHVRHRPGWDRAKARNAVSSAGNASMYEWAIVPTAGSPSATAAATLLVPAKPVIAPSRAAWKPACGPWVRRREKSTTGCPAAARTHRAAFEAIAV
jgi:CBS domain-containing protein